VVEWYGVRGNGCGLREGFSILFSCALLRKNNRTDELTKCGSRRGGSAAVQGGCFVARCAPRNDGAGCGLRVVRGGR